MRWLIVIAVLAPRAAVAEEAPPPPCPLLDRADGVNRAGVALGYSSLNDDGMVDSTALRIDMHGQWLLPVIGVGGYAILPVSYARSDPEVGATNAEWVLGDAELGAVARRAIAPTLDMAVHLGVTLPTAPETTLSATEVTGFANGFAIFARPTDLVQSFGKASYLRLGVTPIHQAGQLFARVDAGVDVPIHSGTDEDLLTIGRLGGAVGAELGGTSLMLELINVIALEKPDNEEDDRVLTFLGLTGVFRAGASFQPLVSLVLPLDDEINDAVDLALIAGLQVLLP